MINIIVDLNAGTTLPDNKVLPWVEGQVKKAQQSQDPINITIGSDLLIWAFRYCVKKQSLGEGFVSLTYPSGVIDNIDVDGNISHVEPDDALSIFSFALF